MISSDEKTPINETCPAYNAFFFYAGEHLETNRGNLSADGLQIQLKTNTGDEGVGIDA